MLISANLPPNLCQSIPRTGDAGVSAILSSSIHSDSERNKNLKTMNGSLKLGWKPIWRLCIGTMLIVSSNEALTQESAFADDFSSDSLSWSTQGSGSGSVRGELGAIVLQADSTTGNDSQWRLPQPPATDFASLTGTLSTATSLGSDFNDQARLRLGARIVNDVAPGGDANHPQGNLGGDINFSLDYYVTGTGVTGAIVCFGREGDNGFEEYNVFGDIGSCNTLDNFSSPLGSPVTLAYELIRDTNTLTFSANDETLDVVLPGEIFEAFAPYTTIEVEAQNASDAIAQITAITTPIRTADFAGTTPIIDRYRPVFFDENNPGSAVVLNEQVRLSAVSLDGEYSGTKIQPLVTTDYLEVEWMLSSESMIANGEVDARLEGELYNDTGDGGTDGRLGDVRSILTMRAYADGRRFVEYCLFRSDDSEFDNRTGLLENENRCQNFPITVELDTPYRVAMALDREASTFTFIFDSFQFVHNITTGIFDASNPGYDVRVAANGGATAIGTIDNLRTSPNALTSEELNANQVVPTPFPEPVDPASLSVESALTAVPFDWNRELSFVDDFSDPNSTALGYWSNSRNGNGESSIEYVDGALELQANTIGNEDGNTYSGLYLNGRTDSVRASVSLSSLSLLHPDPDAEATVRIRAVFHNDIQDFGTANPREGDIPVSIRLRREGDGRFRADYSIGRRDENGDWQDYDIVDGDNYGQFDVTGLALDTIYELSISIDRELSALILTFEDQSIEIPLPTQGFQANQAEALVQVEYRGTSGRAIGRVHSIETDNYQQDFANGTGTLGPYAPVFNARRPGQEAVNEDGRMKLVSDRSLFAQNSTSLFLAGGSSYTGAEVMLSSESTISAGSSARAGIAATLYNDLEAGGGNEGRVYSEMHIEAEDNGMVYAEYCVIRSNDENFSDTTELVTGMPVTDGPLNCSRFDQQVALDVDHAMSIDFDSTQGVIVFTLNGEQQEYAVTTAMYEITRPYNAIIVHASDTGRSVGYFNSFSLSPTPVPLAGSDQILAPDGEATGNGSNADDSTSSGSGGSSGGCSIGGASTSSASFALLFVFALGGIWRRRRLSAQ